VGAIELDTSHSLKTHSQESSRLMGFSFMGGF
jgi:hypothetical protein